MKKIICKVCGSENIKKANGAFVCKDCGTNYTLEQVRKMIVDVPDQPKEENDPRFSHLQSFSTPKKEAAPSNSILMDETTTLVKKAHICLQKEDWPMADSYADRAISIKKGCAGAYVCKLLSELHLHHEEELANCDKTFEFYVNYKQAMEYADYSLKHQLEELTKQASSKRNQTLNQNSYFMAVQMMKKAKSAIDYKAAASTFDSLGDYKDSKQLKEQCLEQMKQFPSEDVNTNENPYIKANDPDAYKDLVISGDMVRQKYNKNITISRYKFPDFNLGDGLLVEENQMALFYRNDFNIGTFKPGKYPLNEKTLVLNEKKDTENKIFKADLYFFNQPKVKKIRWEAYVKLNIYTGERYENGNMRASGDYLYTIDNPERFITHVLHDEKLGKEGLPFKQVKEYVIPMVLVNMRSEFHKIIERNLKADTTIVELKSKVQDEMKEYLNHVIKQFGIQLSDYTIKELTSDDVAIKGGDGRAKKKLIKFLIIAVVLVALALVAYFVIVPMFTGR